LRKFSNKSVNTVNRECLNDIMVTLNSAEDC